MSVLGLTWAFLDGPWDYPSLLERGREAAGGRPRWLPSVCKRVLEQFPERPADAHELELHLRGDPRAAAMDALVRIAKWHFPAPQMVPVHGVLAEFRVPWIETEGALAAFLGITPSELDWFADARRYNTARSDTTLRHYHYRWVKKRTSGYRLFETPKPRLNFQQGMRASRRVRHAPTLLHNAAKFGPESQNREGHSDFQAHLSGRIAWVAATNPRRREKLKSLYARIDW